MSRLNHRTLVLHPDCESLRDFMLSVPERFDRGEGTVIHKGRNELRKMKYGEQEFVVKSFHRPNLINRFVYGIFRPSKAKRSYVHAGMFLEIGVGTPRPVGAKWDGLPEYSITTAMHIRTMAAVIFCFCIRNRGCIWKWLI